MASARDRRPIGGEGERAAELARRLLTFHARLSGRVPAGGRALSRWLDALSLGHAWPLLALTWWRTRSGAAIGGRAPAMRGPASPPGSRTSPSVIATAAPARVTPGAARGLAAAERSAGVATAGMTRDPLRFVGARDGDTGAPSRTARPATDAHAHLGLRSPRAAALPPGDPAVRSLPGGESPPAPASARTAPAPGSEPGRRARERALAPNPSSVELPARLLHGPFRWLADAGRQARIHRGADGDRVALAAGADAVTVGRDIFFRSHRFEPHTSRGLALISHELTHVWQHAQHGGIVRARDDAHLEPALEAQASHVARAVFRALDSRAAAPSSAAAVPSVAPVTLRFALPRAPALASTGLAGPAAGADMAAPARPSRALPLRAPAGHEAPAGEAPGAEPGEVASQVYRLLERKLRVDRERAGVGSA